MDNVKNFQLVSKITNQHFSQYKEPTIRLSKEIPFYVDKVVISAKDKSGKDSTIITFRDSKKRIIERFFDIKDKPLRIRKYTHSDNVIGENEYVKSTLIENFELNRNMLSSYNDYNKYSRSQRKSFWNRTYELSNHFSTNITTNEKVLSQIKVSKTSRDSQLKHTFTEFPHIINDKIDKRNKKYLRYKINHNNGTLVNNGIIEQGVKLDKNDSFIAYRALSIEDLKVYLTKHFIKKRGLDNLGIKVIPEYSPAPNENFIAMFRSYNGTINFNRERTFLSKGRLVSTCRHEVEHCWQYQLYARLTGGNPPWHPWQKKVAKKLGSLDSPDLIAEAKSYRYSIEHYIPYNVNYEEYKKQKIEDCAFREGLKARNQYEREGTNLRKNFPHIPAEFL